MHWDLLNDEEFGSIKLLKLKYRKGDKLIQTFCKIGFPLFNFYKLQDSKKSILNRAECIEI